MSLLTEYEDDVVTPKQTEPTKEPSITGLTFEELAGQMTGFDRIAITKMFGKPVGQVPTDMGVYVGLFVWHRHQGKSDQDAFDAACNTSAAEAGRYFETDDEIDDDHPETESGKRRLAHREIAVERAHWCVVSGQPWELWLTLDEVERAALLAMGEKYGGFL